MQDYTNNINNLASKEDFINFLHLLILDLQNNSSEWENKTLETYLEAVASWVEDMDGYYQNHSLPIPTNISWQVFANILIAAKMYE